MKFMHISDVHLGVKLDAGKAWSEKKSTGYLGFFCRNDRDRGRRIPGFFADFR